MLKKIKKFLSFVLAVIMCLTIVPMADLGIEASAAVTVDQAMAWCEGKVGSKVGSGQCVALIQTYYQYLGASAVSGNGCDYATNSVPSGWSRVQGGVPQKGDILVYTGAKYGHVAIYAGGTTSYHQNMSGLYVEKKTNWAYDNSWYSRTEGGTKSYWGYIRPSFSGSSSFITNIDTAPYDWQTFDKSTTSSFNVAGWAFRNTNELTRVYYCFDDNGYTQLDPVNRQDVLNVYGNTQLDCGFNQNIDISGLSVGNHTFKIWCSSNGIDLTMYYIGITITSSDTTYPTISNIVVRNSPTGYLITCNVSDNIGVTRVRFPTWTSYNGQDDLVWHEGNINPDGKSAWCQIDNSEHNNETGTYYTDIYAYDSSGNEIPYRTVEAYVGEMIKFHSISNTSNGDLGIDISGTPTLSGQVKFWFIEYDMDTNYYVNILMDGNKLVSNSSSDSNGYISYVVDTTTMSNGTHTITADLYDSQAKYTISKNFIVNNSSCIVEFQPYSESGTSTKTVVVSGAYGTLPTPIRKGFVFDGWYTAAIGGTKVTSSTNVTNTSNHTLYAHWKTQSVYFSNNDGATSENIFRPNNCFDIDNQTLNLNGTYSDDSIIDLIPFSATSGEIYKVTATLVSGSMGSGFLVLEGCDAGMVNMSASQYGGIRMHIDVKNSTSTTWTITAKQAAGLSLLKVWVYASDGESVAFNNYKVIIKIEKVSSASASATAYTPAAQYIKNGNTYGTLPTPTRTGYTFDGWYTSATGGTKVTSSTTVTATSNQTLYAHWTCNHSTTEVKNANSATCTAEGYTGDTYCKTCGTKTKTGTAIAKLAHSYTATVTTQATCTKEGVKTYTCTCTASYTDTIAKTAHMEVTDKAVAATCTKTGLTEGKHCSVCNTVIVAQQTVDVIDHADNNGDYKCDNGCGYEFEKPAPDEPTTEPDTPDEPADTDCDHLCHKTGFMGFIWKTIRFLFKLFRTQQFCDCGAAHW